MLRRWRLIWRRTSSKWPFRIGPGGSWNGNGSRAGGSVQSPPVAVAELYGGQMAEVTGYDDDENL